MARTQAIQIHGFDGLAFRVDLDDESGAIARAVQATGGHRFRLGDPEVSDRDANGILRSLVLADVLAAEGDQIPVDLTVADLYVSGSDTLLNDWGGLQLEVEQTDTDLLGLFGTTMSHGAVVKIPRSDLYRSAPEAPSAARLARAIEAVGGSTDARDRRPNPPASALDDAISVEFLSSEDIGAPGLGETGGLVEFNACEGDEGGDGAQHECGATMSFGQADRFARQITVERRPADRRDVLASVLLRYQRPSDLIGVLDRFVLPTEARGTGLAGALWRKVVSVARSKGLVAIYTLYGPDRPEDARILLGFMQMRGFRATGDVSNGYPVLRLDLSR